MLKEKLESIEKGKVLLRRLVSKDDLNIYNRFIFVLASGNEMLYALNKYLPEYASRVRGKVFVFVTEDVAGKIDYDNLIVCESLEQLNNMADYVGMLDVPLGDSCFILVTDNDDFGSDFEELIEMNDITVDDYVKCCLLRLHSGRV
ncbi:MAG: hypothetical protein K5639_02675 [Eubacterium sp.]|nr:hypothetical protein [Eubacterium sp.]